MQELQSVRVGFFWVLVASFVFGNGDRLLAVLLQPTADRIGLLCVSSLAFVLLCFLKP